MLVIEVTVVMDILWLPAARRKDVGSSSDHIHAQNFHPAVPLILCRVTWSWRRLGDTWTDRQTTIHTYMCMNGRKRARKGTLTGLI